MTSEGPQPAAGQDSAEHRIGPTLDLLPCPMVLVDARGFPLHVNRPFEQTYGFTLDELTGHWPLLPWVDERPRFADLAGLFPAVEWTEELLTRDAQGRARLAQVSLRAVGNQLPGGGHLVAVHPL